MNPMMLQSRAGLWWRPVALALAIAPAALSDEPVTVAVKASQPGIEIPDDTLGLSFETSIMLPDKIGLRYFQPDNEKLIALFRTLGIKSLRIGGNSVDDPKIPIPSEADVRSLFDFAKNAGVKVIYSFRLQNGDPASAAGSDSSAARRRAHEAQRPHMRSPER